MTALAIMAGVSLAVGAWPVTLGCAAVLLWRLSRPKRREQVVAA